MSANDTDSSQSNSYNTRSSQNAATTQQNPPPTQQNPPPTQQNPPSTQSTGSSQKTWALLNGTMKIVGHGKKKPSDPHMMLKLEFQFENEPRIRKVALPYKDPSFKSALGFINTALERFLVLEDHEKETKDYFPDFMNQEVLKYQQALDNEGPGDRDERPYREYSKPTIEKLGTNYFLVASEVYDLSRWGHKLDDQEMKDLPIRHCYIGKEVYFKDDKREAFAILMRIISNGNKLQDPEFWSFVLATFTSKLAGKLYVPIIEERKFFHTHMNISGEATGTGKSLLQTVWMRVFEGETQPTLNSITESVAYEKLANGEDIFVKEFSSKKQSGRSNRIGVNFISWAIQTLWERSGSSSSHKKDQRPTAIVHVDANVLPKDILAQLDQPMHDKIYFNYSGPTPLEHDDELEIIDEMIDDGPKLHEYLPVLYALGISALLPRVTPAQREEISYALSDPKDKRQAQVLIQYINVFKACLGAIEEFGLEAPPLFTSGEIDMTSLIYFNHPPEDKDQAKEMASALVEAIKENGLERFLEASGRKSFKIPVSAFHMFPEAVQKQLKSLRKTSSTFDGKRGQKVVSLSEADMDKDTCEELQLIVKASYKIWIKKSKKLQEESGRKYGDMLYGRFPERSASGETDGAHGSVHSDAKDMPELELHDEFSDDLGTVDEVSKSQKNVEDELPLATLKCFKIHCKGYNTTFKYSSELRKHEGLVPQRGSRE